MGKSYWSYLGSVGNWDSVAAIVMDGRYMVEGEEVSCCSGKRAGGGGGGLA